MPNPILILGGTAEAYDLAEAVLAAQLGPVVTSLAGRTAAPKPPAGDWRSGGFGGVDGLRDYLRHHGIRAVVDATHPFAARMGQQAAWACDELSIPLLRLERPAWIPQAGDNWQMVADWPQAVEALQTHSRRALLAIGRQDVAEFLGVPHIFLLIRLITPPDPPLNLHNGQVLCQRGPFSLSSEQDLLRKYQIDSIVCKNSGGTTDAKLLAARQLGLRVIMRQRPNRPTLPVAFDVPQAVEWLYQRP